MNEDPREAPLEALSAKDLFMRIQADSVTGEEALPQTREILTNGSLDTLTFNEASHILRELQAKLLENEFDLTESPEHEGFRDEQGNLPSQERYAQIVKQAREETNVIEELIKRIRPIHDKLEHDWRSQRGMAV